MTLKHVSLSRRTIVLTASAATLLSACGGGGGGDVLPGTSPGGTTPGGTTPGGTTPGGTTPGGTTPGGTTPDVTLVVTSLSAAPLTAKVMAFPNDIKSVPLTATNQFGGVIAAPTISWTSSNPAVATVDGAGRMTAVAVGTAVITAKSGSATLPLDVTVLATPTALSELPAAFPYTASSTTVAGLEVRSDISEAFAQARLSNLEDAWRYMTTYYGGAPAFMPILITSDKNLLPNHVARIAGTTLTAAVESSYVWEAGMPATPPTVYIASTPQTTSNVFNTILQHEFGEWFTLGARGDAKSFAAWVYEGLGLYFENGAFNSAAQFSYVVPTGTDPYRGLVLNFRAAAAAGTLPTLDALFNMTYGDITAPIPGAGGAQVAPPAYSQAGMLVAYLVGGTSVDVMKSVIAEMRAESVTNSAQLEASLLAKLGLANLAALDVALRAWVAIQ
jgi:hypothetical protein